MTPKLVFKRSILLISLLLLTLLLQTAVAQTKTPSQPEALAASVQTETSIIAVHTDDPPEPVLAPASFRQGRSAQAATITVRYINKETTWDTQPGAEDAFQYAVDIWASLLESNTAIVIDAYWKPLGANVLGSAGAHGYVANESGLPQSDTWYPMPLANTLHGSDLNGSNSEINANFNSDFSHWYFGTDSNTPSDKWNFATVVLHEIGHGLGFAGSMHVNGSTGSWGSGTPYPFIYDRFTENGSGTSLFSFGNNTTALGDQLTSNNVFFDGTHSKEANGGSPVKLYAPSTWKSGSSYSHLDEIFNDTDHALMTWSLTNGETNYSPGSVTLGLLEDLGWTMANTTPELSSLPTQLMETGTSRKPAFDLHDYTTPGSSDISSLTYTLTDTGAAGAGISVTNDHFISVSPAGGWSGSTTATVQVSNASSQTDSETVTVVVAGTIYKTYLPITLK